MSPKNKINLKERYEDGTLDLSLSDLQEVPVKEIAAIKKVMSLDLSNNRLTSLGHNFASLTQLVKLDLSKNFLKELPEDFGELRQLKHLDLYSNELTHLPLSFCQLKSLRWLDLKNNSLVPALAKITGPCLDAAQCAQCARDVIALFKKMAEQIEVEKKRLEELGQVELEENKSQLQQKKKDKQKTKAKKNKLKVEPKVEMEDNQRKNDVNKSVERITSERKQIASKHSKSERSLFKTILYTTFLLSIFIFFFTATSFSLAVHLKTKFLYFWNSALQALPTTYQPYALTLTDYFQKVHVITEKLVQNATVFVSDMHQNPHVQTILSVFSEVASTIYVVGQKCLVTASETFFAFVEKIKN